MSSTKYILTSVKAIEFFDKNPSFDFNLMNEILVDLIQRITTTAQQSISVNEVKVLLNTINNKVNQIDTTLGHNNKMIQMTYDHIGEQKTFYVEQMKSLFERDKNSDVLSLIRESNHSFLDKATYTILQQFPKLGEQIKTIQQEVVNDSQVVLQRIYEKTSTQIWSRFFKISIKS